jgi:hypothetical protein
LPTCSHTQYETFAFDNNSNCVFDEVDCTKTLLEVAGLGYPVIRPNTYTLTLNEPARE